MTGPRWWYWGIYWPAACGFDARWFVGMRRWLPLLDTEPGPLDAEEQ